MGILALNEDAFRPLMDALPEAVLIITKSGAIRYLNKSAQAILGFSQEEVEGEDLSFLLPSRDDRRVEALKWISRWAYEPIEQAPRHVELLGRSKSGAEVPLYINVSEVPIDEDSCYLITLHDRTQVRKEKEEQKDLVLRMARALAVAEDAVVSVDQEQNIEFFNLRAERMFGYTAEDVIGKSLDILLPESSRGGHRSMVENFGKSDSASRLMSERGEVSAVRKNGEIFPVEASITVIHTGGKPTYTAHLRDITEKKKVREALEERERRFHAIFDSAMQAMGLLDVRGRVLELNWSARELMRSKPTLGATSLWEVDWVTGPEGAIDGGSDLEEAVSLAAKGETVRRTLRSVDEAGEERVIDFDLVPVKGADDTVEFIIAEGRTVSSMEQEG